MQARTNRRRKGKNARAKPRRQARRVRANIQRTPKFFSNMGGRWGLNGGIPMASSANVEKYFNLKNMGETAVRVKGCDLIYKIPSSLTPLVTTPVMTVIPANPAYWVGTRIAALAQGYQNYRPLAMKVHYIPQCPVTQQGNVLGGTFWEDVPSPDSLQQSLKTSNGGFLTQCYQPATSVIRMKSNLQYNLYRMAGEFNQQSNPFNFIAIAIATLNNGQLINPGYFFVEYDYVLKNPIGVSTVYSNTGMTDIETTTDFYTNSVAICCSDVVINGVTFPVGTRLDIEYSIELSEYMWLYNGTPVDTPAIPLWIFQNQPIAQPIDSRRLAAKIPVPYTEKLSIPSDRYVGIDPGATNYFVGDGQDIWAYTNVGTTRTTVQIPSTYTDRYLLRSGEDGVLGQYGTVYNAMVLITFLSLKEYVLKQGITGLRKEKKALPTVTDAPA